MVPVTVGLALSGVQVMVFPETQYEYCAPVSVVITFPAVVDWPLKAGSLDTKPAPPFWLTVAGQSQKAGRASTQVAEA